MKTFLIIVLLGLMAMVLYSLVRGIVAFLKTSKADLERPAGEGPSASQLAQNKAMMQRILFQGAAIVLVAVLLAVAGK